MSSGTSSLLSGSDWVGRVVDGRFTLQHWLGGAGQSAVFRTQIGDPPQSAAIKLIPAGAGDAESLLAQWTAAAGFFHPHLMRLFHAGRCRIDGQDLLYAVTEYSEEVLSEILPARPLTPGEVREMLDPILDALAWLHQRGLVHGGLKPSNLMVIDEQLKLSVDRVQPAGTRGSTSPSSDIHVAPDSAESISPATDIWSLGVLVVETLTQQTPHRDGTRAADPVLPASVPEPFATIARECLRIYPARRCSLDEIRSYVAAPEPTAPPTFTDRAADAPPLPPGVPDKAPAPAATPPAQIPEKPAAASPSSQSPPTPFSAPPAAKAGGRPPLSQNETVFATAALILIAAIGILTFFVPTQKKSPPAAATHLPAAVPTPAGPPYGAPASGPTAPGAVLHRALPDVPQDASDTIRGHIRVSVRVSVDPSGNVSNAELDRPGPSRYFANLALDAARNWKFRPAQIEGRAVPSTWLLHFEFARTGTDVTPEETGR
jgi:TonB family protein